MTQTLIDRQFVPTPQQLDRDFEPTFTLGPERTSVIPNVEAYISYSKKPTEDFRNTPQVTIEQLIEENKFLRNKLAYLISSMERASLTANLVSNISTSVASIVNAASVLASLTNAANTLASLASVVNTVTMTSLSEMLEEKAIRTYYSIVPKRTNTYLVDVYEAKRSHLEAQGRRYIDIDLSIDDDGEDE